MSLALLDGSGDVQANRLRLGGRQSAAISSLQNVVVQVATVGKLGDDSHVFTITKEIQNLQHVLAMGAHQLLIDLCLTFQGIFVAGEGPHSLEKDHAAGSYLPGPECLGHSAGLNPSGVIRRSCSLTRRRISKAKWRYSASSALWKSPSGWINLIRPDTVRMPAFRSRGPRFAPKE